MDEVELIEDILGISDRDYKYGVAEVSADCVTMEDLNDNGLLDMDYSLDEAPSVGEFYEFLRKWENREIELKLMVIDPKRDDFRIGVKSVSINSEYVKLRNNEDILFWKDFMTLGKKGYADMTESDERVNWEW